VNIDEREQGLLKLIADYREQECQRILEEADAQARALRRQAFARQRLALHERIIAERSRAQSLIQAAEAERATRARRRSEQRDAALVDAAWPLLREALQGRWEASDSRRRWVALAFTEAQRRLPHGDWLVRHPASWPEADRAATAGQLGAQGASTRFRADDDIAAGLIIIAGGAELDMSLNGLLRDRARLEARMIALSKNAGALGVAPASADGQNARASGADA
jgi:hypothetical protein